MEKIRNTYVFDIDGTICTQNLFGKSNYENAEPMNKRINKINALYDDGNTIIYLTARGMGRHNNNADAARREFYDLTQAQLEQWGCKYHHLFLGKPAGDFYIDDKGVHDEDFFAY